MKKIYELAVMHNNVISANVCSAGGYAAPNKIADCIDAIKNEIDKLDPNLHEDALQIRGLQDALEILENA